MANSLAVAPGVVLAGVCDFCGPYNVPGGGVYRTEDDGRSWTNVLTASRIDKLAFSPSNPSVVYAIRLAGEGTQAPSRSLWTSSDAGRTWSATPLNGVSEKLLQVDPASPFGVWVSTQYSLLHSIDSGSTWTTVLGKSVTSLAISPSDPTTIYAGTDTQGAFRTRDGGHTWVAVSLVDVARGGLNVDVLSLAVDAMNPKRVLAVGSSYFQPNFTTPAIYRSEDGGDSSTATGLFARSVVAAPNAPGTFYSDVFVVGFERLVYLTRDGGVTWPTEIGSPPPTNTGVKDFSNLVLHPLDPSTLYATATHGVYRVALDSQTLSLGSGRFQVRVTWRNSAGEAPAAFVPLTQDTGAFWFFTPNNLEVVIKVVDGRGANGHFWVFGAALTDVEYDLEITDTTSGAVWKHHNSQGTLASYADTSAF
ncbi:MAG: hypothetical protein ABI682_12255 [Acidobacteriota bacterium]